MSVPKHWLLGGRYTRGLIVHQLRYWPSDSNANVDIKSSAHDAFLEYLLPGTLKVATKWHYVFVGLKHLQRLC